MAGHCAAPMSPPQAKKFPDRKPFSRKFLSSGIRLRPFRISLRKGLPVAVFCPPSACAGEAACPATIVRSLLLPTCLPARRASKRRKKKKEKKRGGVGGLPPTLKLFSPPLSTIQQPPQQTETPRPGIVARRHIPLDNRSTNKRSG